MALTKCCCCIPLRAGAFIIGLWFLIVNGFEAVSGFLGRNTVISYASQSSAAIFWAEIALSLLIAVGGLFGLIGSCCASRGFITAFSIITWISCLISIVKHVGAVVLIAIHRNEIVDECTKTGLVALSSSSVTLSSNGTWTNGNSTYSPVLHEGTINSPNLTSNSTAPPSRADCEKDVEIFLIVTAVVIIFIELMQIYFASVVGAYATKLRTETRHHKLRDQQIKDWDEAQMPMKDSVY